MCKNDNPIDKVPTVKISVWEYKSLVGKAAILETLQRMVEDDKKYVAADVLGILFKDREVE